MKNDDYEYEILSPDDSCVNEDRVFDLDNAIAIGRKFCNEVEQRGGFSSSKRWGRLSPGEVRGQTFVVRFGDDGCEYVASMAELIEREKARDAFKELTEKCLEVVRDAIREEFARERRTERETALNGSPSRSLERVLEEPER